MTGTSPSQVRARAAASGGLMRILGIGFGLAVIIGSTLGIGILRTPGLVAHELGSPGNILLVWLVGGVYTLLGSVCLTELGTALPQAGGYYVYARRTFGDTVGFAVGWTDWLTYCAVLGYVSIGIGEFSTVLLHLPDPAAKHIAIAALLSFTALQWAGVRVGSQFQQVTTALKSLAFLTLVVACFIHAARSPALAMGADQPTLNGPTLFGMVVALQSVVITYAGWQSALYFAEEDRDPLRTLPMSMIGGVLSVIVIYLLVNLALLAVLPLPALSQSTLPAAVAAQVVFGGRGNQIITLLSLVSLLPLINAIMMIGTRILFALGRDGLLWRSSAVVSDRGTPTRAALVTTGVAVALIWSGTFQKLVAVASFFLAANYCVCCLALIVLRRREPLLARPFRAWGYPWSAGIVLAGATLFLGGVLVGDTQTALVAVGLLAVGLLGKFFVSRRIRPTSTFDA
jgi:APA family basic amino acid/polyamine antiporter